MTPHYFTFQTNGSSIVKNSQDMGVQVVQYPPIVRAKERLKQITIPGRSGALTLREGLQVYDVYTRRMRIACRLDEVQQIQAWLSGRGTFASGNEPGFEYDVEFNEPFSVERLMNGWVQGDITMICQPFKHQRPNPSILVTNGSSVTMPARKGDLISPKPTIVISNYSKGATVTGSGWQITVTEAGTTNIRVDVANEIIGGNASVDAWPDVPYNTTVAASGCNARIYPNWGWL